MRSGRPLARRRRTARGPADHVPGRRRRPTQVIHDLEWAAEHLDWAIVDSRPVSWRLLPAGSSWPSRVPSGPAAAVAAREWIFWRSCTTSSATANRWGRCSPTSSPRTRARAQGPHAGLRAAAGAVRRLRDLAARGAGDPQDQDSVVGRQLEYWGGPADGPARRTRTARGPTAARHRIGQGAPIDFTVPACTGRTDRTTGRRVRTDVVHGGARRAGGAVTAHRR